MEENHSEEASETRRRTVLGALERVGARWSGGAESGAGGVVYLREPKKGAAHRRCRAPF